MQQQADIQTKVISKNSSQSSKDREAQRREKQRQETAVPKKGQRKKLMAIVAEAKAAKLNALAVASEYMTTREAAVYLKLSRQYLEAARYRGDGSGPAYVKLERAVRYRRSVLDAWMSAHDHSPEKPIYTE